MKRFLSPIIILLALGFFTMGSRSTVWAQEDQHSLHAKGIVKNGPSFIQNEILVKFKSGIDDDRIKAIHRRRGATLLKKNRHLRLDRIRVSGNIDEAIADYQTDPSVEYAQPNYQIKLHIVPNDPLYDNNGVPGDLQQWVYGASNLNAEAAWDLTPGRPDVVVAVIDTGVSLGHRDLSGNIWVNTLEAAGLPGVDDDGNGFIDDFNGWDFCSGPFNSSFNPCSGEDNDPNPDTGDGIDNDGSGFAEDGVFHGTFVAGNVAAMSNNAIDVAGSAWFGQIMALKVFTEEGSASTADIIDAMTYAATNGADVINMSLGADGIDCPTQDLATEDAVNFAFNSGVTVIAAAGNANSSNPSTPASCTNAMSIGASDSGSVAFGGSGEIDGRASFSNYGANVDVVAPGDDIVSTYVCSMNDVNTNFAGCSIPGDPPPEGTAIGAGGTSFSSPIVAGLASLVIARGLDLGLTLTPTEVRAIIQDTAQDLPDDPNDVPNAGADWDGNGRVDFLAALSAVGIAPSPLGSITGTVTDSTGAALASRVILRNIDTGVRMVIRSDAGGFFAFSDLSANNYVVIATRRDFSKDTERVVLIEGEDRMVNLTIDPLLP